MHITTQHQTQRNLNISLQSQILVKLIEVDVFGILKIRLFKLVGSIVNNMERINTRKRNQLIIV